MATIQYTFKGQKHEVHLEATASTHGLLETISAQTSLPAAGLKVSYKGKALKVDHENPSDTSEHLLIKYPGINAPNVRLFVLGTTEHDIAKVHTIDSHVQTRKNFRPPPAAKRSQPVRTAEDDKYTFGSIQVLPQFDQQDKAQAVLERLKQDKGIIGIMKLHKWQVGSLIELSPAEKTILGYNRNKGELIALRLRTDDLEGFRHYDAVWSEHDDNFHALNRQLNKEVQQLDWTAQGGNKVSQGDFYNPETGGIPGYHDDLEDVGNDGAWQGGTYVLGGGSRGRTETMTTRELAARAAQLRQIESEKDEDGMCGAK
ncbi:hypothetical protein BG005_006790 [Podila minutissima]|nr:hypothetical protein BG005_006790 [Podila minutissima]